MFEQMKENFQQKNRKYKKETNGKLELKNI